MESLEQITSKTKSDKDNKIESYKGLTLLDNKIYSSGTSVKYWM